ncbi:MAG: response regulator [Anaerolineales bacterium]|nr:response regulator [Anaerolineales bacterium]
METNKGYLLVVEDIPDILTLLDTTLKFKGYRVVTARNGQEALEQVQKEAPALVITDILMPKMDGFSLVHRLRLEPETRTIPVLFLSATYVAPEDKTFALTIGATRFMEKPVVLDDFLKLIEELMAKPAQVPKQPLSEKDFYEGYRKRLEIKLAEKNTQIIRAEGLLKTVAEHEKESFSMSMLHAVNERKEILRLLEEVDARLANEEKEEKNEEKAGDVEA